LSTGRFQIVHKKAGTGPYQGTHYQPGRFQMVHRLGKEHVNEHPSLYSPWKSTSTRVLMLGSTALPNAASYDTSRFQTHDPFLSTQRCFVAPSCDGSDPECGESRRTPTRLLCAYSRGRSRSQRLPCPRGHSESGDQKGPSFRYHKCLPILQGAPPYQCRSRRPLIDKIVPTVVKVRAQEADT